MKKFMMLGAAVAALAMMSGCNKSQGQEAAAGGGSGGDQKITLAQFEQRRIDQMMKADANGDGKVTKDEYIASMKQRAEERGDDPNDPDAASRWEAMFARMDKAGAGYVTKDQIKQSADEMFARIDTAHKGYITRDEMRQRFRGAGQGGGQGGFGGGQGGGGQGGGGQGGGG